MHYLETGESYFCTCGHTVREHKITPLDSPPSATNPVFYHARECLGCKEGCGCLRFTAYKIDPETIGRLLEENKT
jgi:hypothetical protein